MKPLEDVWNSGDPYDYYMGRWSRLVAPVFLKWLNVPGHLWWLDVGCGTGALGEAVFRHCRPAHLSCIDPSEGFVQKAKERLNGGADFAVSTASGIPYASHLYDVVVTGLALNFFPDLAAALSEMKRVAKPHGTIAAYVWDYAGRMDFLRVFWEAAAQLDPKVRKLDEGVRFPICNTDRLKTAFEGAGLEAIETAHLDIYTIFRNFDDYWNPFLGGQGPAPAYLASLLAVRQEQLRTRIQNRLPVEADGSITLLARALAVRGSCSADM